MAPPLSMIRFLVVDDSAAERKLIHALLTGLGAEQIDEAMDGESAIQSIKHQPPGLILCDWEMEPISGLHLARFIRRSPACPDKRIPLIMMTGHADRQRVVAARDAGVNEFMVKPLSPQTLQSRISAALDSRRPFINAAEYFGPDRRRHAAPWSGAERRSLRKAPEIRTRPAPVLDTPSLRFKV
ncbi:chemotaxis protein CheY [mine drainage metagenome]|uniref:Chemotaxis protein CheY n=1 Tax=mine drainage metagenome TaxID=410659 RepID=A0A1J5SX84_9ZZZZ